MNDQVDQLISRCSSFERCGPSTASLIRVSGASLTVVKECITWPVDVERKITKDSRTSQLSDLLAVKRDQFGAALEAMTERLARPVETTTPKPKGPGMG